MGQAAEPSAALDEDPDDEDPDDEEPALAALEPVEEDPESEELDDPESDELDEDEPDSLLPAGIDAEEPLRESVR